MESLLSYLLIDLPEAFLILSIGLAVFNKSSLANWKKGLLFTFLFGSSGVLFSFVDLPYQPKVLSMYILMYLLFIFLLKEGFVKAAFMCTAAIASNILAEFILIFALNNILKLSMAQLAEHKLFQYATSFTYLLLLALTWLALRLVRFDIRMFAPKKRHNRYLVLLVLVGSIEFLLILFLNTSYILQQSNATLSVIGSPEQQMILQLLTLVLFIIMVFLFRTYLNLTINRVEEETETPYLQNINDLLTAIRSIKHDVVNHYTAIQGFLKKEMYGLAQEYVRHQLQEAATIERAVESSGQVVQHIKSPAVSALLSSKMAICMADRISFSIHVTTTCQFSFMKTNDLIKVLGNLLDNAIHAAQFDAEESRFINLVWSQDEYEQFLMIENSGPTIPEEKISHVFDLGFTTKTDEKGGVGLAVVKSVIDRYGGRISLHSEKGVTCFRISFSLS
ncbi:sensor histidine kinase [Brevibacillus migulae]|uniref:sensor histidine kinase n=1 Tax=Brevibacillus migulae TaxID=1644114 RepID=UPI00106DD3A5|nr:ATP-binding protein [Brevibacillus migulae]